MMKTLKKSLHTFIIEKKLRNAYIINAWCIVYGT